jgi:Protein of unknown function (DUF4058)
MSSPFPGMAPYLEQPLFWQPFHHRLIVAIADAIESQLNQQYYIEVKTRTYQSSEGESILVGVPDATVFVRTENTADSSENELGRTSVAVQSRPQRIKVPVPQTVYEQYLEIREVATDAIVTVIEVLSPKNKRSGEGRDAYEKKRRSILGSLTHFVEIDLLRGGKPMPMLDIRSPSMYRILVSRSHQRPDADLYGFGLPDSLPVFPVPLKPNEPEPIIDLPEIFNGIYKRARHSIRLDYAQPLPPPKLSDPEQQWVERLFQR